MDDIYNNYVEDTFGDREQAVFKFKQFEYNYRSYFPKSKDAKVLDIGVGRGEMLYCMKKWGYNDYLGVDISPSTISFCKSLNLNCLLVEDTIKWLESNQNTFDLITLIDVLEHIKKENTIEFIRTIYKSLKPSGVLIIQVPNMQAPYALIPRYIDITHEVGYIEKSLQQVLLTSGAKKIFFNGYEDFVNGGVREN